MKIFGIALHVRTILKRAIDHLGRHTRRPPSLNRTIAIFGAPRSGTTWLMEILAVMNGYRTIFEPLNTYFFPAVADLGFPNRIYIDPTDNAHSLKAHLTNVIDGWTVSRSPAYKLSFDLIQRRLTGSDVVMKFINGNRIISWFCRAFTPRLAILLIRHPCAAIASQLASGWVGYPLHIERALRHGNIEPLRVAVLAGARAVGELSCGKQAALLAEKASSSEELLAIEWALDYRIPFECKLGRPWTLISYEDLVLDPEAVMMHLFGRLGEIVSEAVRVRLEIPSSMARGANVENRNRQIMKWQSKLSKKKVDIILETVHMLGVSIYSQSPLPDSKKLCLTR